MSDIGQRVKLCGWLQFRRLDNFVVLRDAYGLTQLVLLAENRDAIETVAGAPLESVIAVDGKVVARPVGQENEKLATGAIEVVVDKLDILSRPTIQLPFNIKENMKVKEALRMQYRYLDLRHSVMQRNLRLRSEVVMRMREFLVRRHGFVDVETPTLFRRTPGGAQEFVVPTRTAGKFYSLVQSPQQFKQMLMVGGLDRYFQIARCYRDEGSKPNRQPEFTQVDIEMSFASREGIQRLVEGLLQNSWPAEACGSPGPSPFPQMSYADAMSRYGVDKPDLRFDSQLQDVTEVVDRSGLADLVAAGRADDARAVAVVFKRSAPLLTRKAEEQLKKLAGERRWTADGGRTTLLTLRLDAAGRWKSTLAKKVTPAAVAEINGRLDAAADDLILLALGSPRSVFPCMGQVRLATANLLEAEGATVRDSGLHFLWVVDFPLFLPSDEDVATLESAHHPFTAPHPDDAELLYTRPQDVRGQHYDLVLNGSEIGGGSIRIHRADLQLHVLTEVLGIDPSTLHHLVHALQCGCPPHGGIALGLDRLVSIQCGATSIRDVMAFPKGFQGQDLMSGAPSAISDQEKSIYHI